MKIINAILVVFSSASIAAHASAADTSFKYIKPLVSKYAAATGCADDTLDPKLVSKFSDKANGIENAYIAAINTDSDCMGGSGTSGSALIVLRTAEGRDGIDDPKFDYLKIVPAMSVPIAGTNMPTRMLTSLYQKDGQLFATGQEYGEKDANCCPSLKAIYKINLIKRTVSLTKDDNRSLYTWNFVKVKNY